MSEDTVYEFIVHTFTIGDVEDPELYASSPLANWEKSEQGQWVMKHAIESPVWHQSTDPYTWGYKFVITAKFKEREAVLWALRQ